MFTAITLKTMISYLNERYKIYKGYLNNIRYSEYDFYILKLSTEYGRISIIIDIKRCLILPLYVAEVSKKRENAITDFFRKIKNVKILDFSQIDLERILLMKIKDRQGYVYNIYFEMFNGGNIIITDENNKILAVKKRIETKHRKLRIGEKYVFPPKNKLNIDEIKSSDLIGKKKSLFKLVNLDPITIRYILRLCDIKEEYINMDKAEKILSSFKSFLTNLSNSKFLSFIRDKKGKYYILPYLPKGDPNLEIIWVSDNLDSFSKEFILKYYPKFLVGNKTDLVYMKLIKDRENIRNKIAELEEKYKKYHGKISYLYSKIDYLYDLFNKIKVDISKLGDKVVKIDKKKKILYLKTDDITIPLRYDVNPYKAISILYEDLKKLKNGIEKMRQKLSEIDNKLNSIYTSESQAKIFIDKEVYWSKKWYEKYIWSISTNGLLIVGGKDANSNEVIIKKYLESNDLVFHADVHGSPFVLLKNGINGREDDIKDAAVITASYSKAWKYEIGAVNVYYVTKEQVSKKAPSGEYLKKGSFMIYGDKSFVRNAVLELYLGPAEINGSIKILIGTLSSLKKNTIYKTIFKIRPGNMSRSYVAEKIINFYVSKNLLRKGMKDLYLNDLINRLPGKSHLEMIVV